MLMAIGEAVDVANDLRKAAAARDKAFAISEKVYAGCRSRSCPSGQHNGRAGSGDNGRIFPTPRRSHRQSWTLHGELGRRAMLRRLWAGG